MIKVKILQVIMNLVNEPEVNEIAVAEVEALPSRHETIIIGSKAYICINVEHHIAPIEDTSNESSINIIVDDIETYKQMMAQQAMMSRMSGGSGKVKWIKD
jgi:hypothetical protein